MKIALFSETYSPDVNGVVAHVKTLKSGLEQLGHEVLVVAADKHCKHHYVQDGILHCPSIEAKRFYGFGVAAPFPRKRMRLIKDFAPDIIHIHQEFGIGLSGVLAARRLGKPLVYTLHTMYDQYVYYVAPRPFLAVATKVSHQYMRFIANRAQALTGPSQKCREYFARIGVDKPISIIPNSADLDMFGLSKVSEDAKAQVSGRFGIPRDKTLAIFVGRLGKEKSVDVLLEYWAKEIRPEHNLHLVIVGGGPHKKPLEQMARDLDIQNRVTFTGMVSHTEMPALFAVCDVYVTASLSEMNSISMLEGMASGLPTLQRYDELNKSQIVESINGWLYDNENDFAKHLLRIAGMSREEKDTMKITVHRSVVDRGSGDLAKYMLGIYEGAARSQH
ncbi:MAG: glycosyltransferase [Oscillospiraceae bacterium]|nr:glycosyltransferase [Oscillospiraceae bacterium]